MTDREIIAAAYDAGVEEEFNRLVSTPLFEAEFELITDLMKKYIRDGSVVIDIGAGPGRYAEFLLNRNCTVGTVDLSQKCLDAFHNRISQKSQESVLFSKVACATDLSFIEDGIADAVVLMGPLYHLIHCEERTKAIAEAFRLLKPGGYLFAVFMSTFNHAEHSHEGDTICCSDFVKRLLSESVTTVKFQGYQVPQYKCMPRLAVSSFEPHGMHTLHLRNLEGIGTRFSEKDLSYYTTKPSKQELFDKLRNECEVSNTSGLADQFLYVGRKNNTQE
jgi:ubiquinone/menaquinone biosynthesis C-methylase UbiE